MDITGKIIYNFIQGNIPNMDKKYPNYQNMTRWERFQIIGAPIQGQYPQKLKREDQLQKIIQHITQKPHKQTQLHKNITKTIWEKETTPCQ